MVDELLEWLLLKIIVVVEEVSFIYNIYVIELKIEYQVLLDKFCFEFYKIEIQKFCDIDFKNLVEVVKVKVVFDELK